MTDTTTTRDGIGFDPDLLAGRFFHTTRRCAKHGGLVAIHQGQIIGYAAPGVLLVEHYSWLDGGLYGQQLTTVADFMASDPLIYPDEAEMHASYQEGAVRHTRKGCPPDAEAES